MFNLFIILFILCYITPGNNPSKFQKTINTKQNSSIPAAKIEINNKTFFEYALFISNQPSLDNKGEISLLNIAPQNIYRDFLLAIIKKREVKYHEMYSVLKSYLKSYPEFYTFYDELIFAASATGKTDEIKRIFENNRRNNSFYYYGLSLLLTSRNEYESALKKIDKAIQLDPENFYTLFQKANLYKNIGDYDEALKYSIMLQKIYSDNPEYASQIENLKGVLYNLSGLYEEAFSAYKKAMHSSELCNYKKMESKIFTNLGIIFDETGELDSGRAYFRKAINIAENISDIESAAFALSELGVSYTYTNDLVSAKQNYLESYSLYTKLGNKTRLSYLSNNLGRVYSGYSNYQLALEFFEDGIKLAGENKRAQIQNLIGAADVYANLSNYSVALSYYNRAKKIAGQINEINLQAEVDIGLGSLNYNLNQLDNAAKYFYDAERKAKQSANIYLQTDIYSKLGITFLGTGSYEKAAKYFLLSIKSAQEISDIYTELISSLNLSSLYLKTKNLDKAEALIKKYKNLSNSYELTEIIAEQDFILGKIYVTRGNNLSALKCFTDASSKGNEVRNYNLVIESYYEIARLNQQQNNFKRAEEYYQLAVELTDKISKHLFGNNEIQISYFSGKNEIFKNFAEFYIWQGNYEKAFEIIERGRSRNTMNNLNNLLVQSKVSDKKKLDKLFEQDWMLHSGLFSGNLDSLIKANKYLKSELIYSDPEAGKYLHSGNSVSINELKTILSGNEYLLSIYTAENYSVFFIAGKNSFNAVKINITREELFKKLKTISSYFSKDKRNETFINPDLFSFDANASFKFYEEIFFPVLKKVPENSRLIISPSTEFAALPLEFLIIDMGKNESRFEYSSKKYLLSKYDISYIPSAGTLFNLRQKRKTSSKEVLLVGNPYVNNSSFSIRRGLIDNISRLPRNISFSTLKYSEEEIESIENAIGADKILLAQNATESEFKINAPNSYIIHLSTHSFLFNNQPFIYFSPDHTKTNDGFLETGEIIQLKLNADIVVLSSCSSGLGLLDEAEGVIGLTKAFYEAGAKAVVISLWDVNDNYTSKLMGLFYRYLSDGLDKSSALRQAKLEFIKSYSSNPYYWAAFTLSGNTSPLLIEKTSFAANYQVLLLITVCCSLVVFYLIKRNKKKAEQSIKQSEFHTDN